MSFSRGSCSCPEAAQRERLGQHRVCDNCGESQRTGTGKRRQPPLVDATLQSERFRPLCGHSLYALWTRKTVYGARSAPSQQQELAKGRGVSRILKGRALG
jgi:hypothetical protein